MASAISRAREFFEWSPACGTAGRMTPSSATSRAASIFDPDEAARARPQGRAFHGPRAAQHRPADPGLAGDRAGRRVGGRPADRRRDGRGGVQPASRRSPSAALLRRHEGPHGDSSAAIPRPSEDPAGRLRRGRRHAGRGAGQEAPARQPGPSRQRHRLAVDAARPSMPRASIWTGRCPKSPRATPARAAASGSIDLARRENLTVRQLAQHRRRRLRRRWRSSARPRRSPIRWRNGWSSGGCDGFNVMFPYLPRRARRLRRPRGAGAAAARAFPARIRGRDAARKPRPAAAAEPLLRQRLSIPC